MDHHRKGAFARPGILALVALALSGCATLLPNTVSPVVEHKSHASQHMDGTRGHMGAELVGLVAHWQMGAAFLNVEESYNVSPADGHACLGGICGERELFQAQFGYEFQVRGP